MARRAGAGPARVSRHRSRLMPGHGDSAGADRNYGLSETARIVDAFMSGLELRSPIVIGHSWGGGVTLVHATASASKVEPGSIVLVDPLLRMPLVDAAEYRQALSEHSASLAGKQADRLRMPIPVAHVRRLLEGRGA